MGFIQPTTKFLNSDTLRKKRSLPQKSDNGKHIQEKAGITEVSGKLFEKISSQLTMEYTICIVWHGRDTNES